MIRRTAVRRPVDDTSQPSAPLKAGFLAKAATDGSLPVPLARAARGATTLEHGVPADAAPASPPTLGHAPDIDTAIGSTRVFALSLPNLITIARVLLVPVVIWAITSREMQIAFLLFLTAGLSDAVDGFLAKRLNMTTELGAHLDPLADKVLIVSIYVALGITDEIPRWLAILVVSRDLLIVGGVMLAWFLGKPVRVKPALVSKLNTVAQIVFACLVLAELAFRIDLQSVQTAIMALVAVLTLASIGFYVQQWVLHMSAADSKASR
jgi:cardiolipin synthase (CMP-forming)